MAKIVCDIRHGLGNRAFLYGLTSQQECALAKAYGAARGYHGRQGGWVYHPTTGKPFVQGWMAFWLRLKCSISEWAIEAGRVTVRPQQKEAA